MSIFVALLKDKRKGRLDIDLLHGHVEYLREQTALGRIRLCGPFADNGGALQLIAAQDFGSAKAILESDPFIKEGYYGSYELHELIEANEQNNWLISDSQTADNLADA